MTAEALGLIRRLGLEPHPEGGHYREVVRSGRRVEPADGRPSRSAVTVIHFLLAGGQHSRWHRVSSDEIWQYERGAPLELYVLQPGAAAVETIVLGADAELIHLVPAGAWQAARPRGEYTLCACTVAPGFEFDDFTFLADDDGAAEGLRRIDASLSALL